MRFADQRAARFARRRSSTCWRRRSNASSADDLADASGMPRALGRAAFSARTRRRSRTRSSRSSGRDARTAGSRTSTVLRARRPTRRPRPGEADRRAARRRVALAARTGQRRVLPASRATWSGWSSTRPSAPTKPRRSTCRCRRRSAPRRSHRDSRRARLNGTNHDDTNHGQRTKSSRTDFVVFAELRGVVTEMVPSLSACAVRRPARSTTLFIESVARSVSPRSPSSPSIASS